MGAPAWQRREGERREFLEELTTEMHYRAEEYGTDLFYFELALMLFTFLEQRWGGIAAEEVVATHEESIERVERFFNEVIERTEDFARSPAERDGLLAQLLLGQVLPTALEEFHSELSRQELEDPQTIFHASSATEEVPLEAE